MKLDDNFAPSNPTYFGELAISELYDEMPSS